MTEPLFRYPGTRPFTTQDEAIFFGRKQDVDKLYQLMSLKNMLIFYSASGMGKSSLIKAGLIPRFNKELSEKSYKPITVRFGAKGGTEEENNNGSDTLLEIVIAELKKEAATLTDKHLLFTTEEEINDSLWCLVKLFEKNNIQLILIFDQSEEIFTYQKQQIDQFKEELYLLFNRNIPSFLHQRVQEKLEVLASESVTASGSISTQLHDTSPEKIETINNEIEFIYSALKSKILFAVREDKLGLFNVFNDYFPDVLKDTYKLLPLTKANAEEAITGPCALSGNFMSNPFTYSPEALTKLLNNIKEDNDTYDPFSIQLNCSYIEANCVIKESKTVIEAGDIPDEGKIVKEYYTNVWKAVPGSDVEIDNYKKEIEEKLIDQKQEIRKYVYEKDLESLSSILLLLQQKGLIRQDQRGDDHYIELSHDRLIGPLIEASKMRAADELLKKEHERELERAAIEKEKSKRKRKRLRLWVYTAVALLLLLIVYSVMREVHNSREFELLQAYNSVDKSNPTLAYNIAVEGKEEGFSVFDKFTRDADNENLGYISAAFAVPEVPISVYISSNNKHIIVVGKSSISHFKKNGVLDSVMDVNGTILQSTYSKGNGFAVVETSNAYANNSGQGEFKVISFNGATLYTFKHENTPVLLSLSESGEKVIADNKLITRGSVTAFSDEGVSAVCFLPNGSIIKAFASGTISNETSSYETYSAVHSLGALNDTLVMAVTSDFNIRFIDLKNNVFPSDDAEMERRNKIDVQTSGLINTIGFSSNDRKIVCGTDDRVANIYNEEGKKMMILKGHTSKVISANFSDDDTEIVTASATKEVFLWKMEKPSKLYEEKEMKTLSAIDRKLFNLPGKEVENSNSSLEEDIVSINNNHISYIRQFYSDEGEDPDNSDVYNIITTEFESVLQPPASKQLSKSQAKFLAANYSNVLKLILDRVVNDPLVDYNSYLDKSDSIDISFILADTVDVRKAMEFHERFNYFIHELEKDSAYSLVVDYAYKDIKLLNAFYLKDSTNTDIKKSLSNMYSIAAYYSCFIGKYEQAIENSVQALKILPTGYIHYSNLALGYLLSGQYDKALPIYSEYGKKLSESFAKDLKELEDAGVISPENSELVKQVANIKNILRGG